MPDTAILPDRPSHPAGGHYSRYFKPGYVHRDLYVSETIFQEEMRHLFGNSWVYVGHESEIPNGNDFIRRRIGRRPVILCRTQEGAVSVLINRCTHRGAIVCRKDRGNARRFTCGYHAWSFLNDGKCTGIPLRHAYGADFQLQDQDLHRPAKVDSYRGFIFASMTANVPPLVEHLAGATGFIDQWLDRGNKERVLLNAGSMPFLTHANWKTVYDNAGDGYHPPFSHDSMLRVFARRYGSDTDMSYYRSNFDESPILSKDLGNGHTTLDQRPAMHKESAWRRQHVSPGAELTEAAMTARFGAEAGIAALDASTGSGLNLNIFPNLLIIGNQIQLIEPISVRQTAVHWFSTVLEGAPDEVNATRMRMQEDFPSFGEVDDTAQFESCQEGLESVPEMEWVDIRRHMSTNVGRADDDGLYREPISSDLHLRTYYAAWQRVMEAGFAAAATPAEAV